MRTLKIRTELLKREFDLFSSLQGQLLDTTRPLRAALEILQAYRGGLQAFSSSPMASPVHYFLLPECRPKTSRFVSFRFVQAFVVNSC